MSGESFKCFNRVRAVWKPPRVRQNRDFIDVNVLRLNEFHQAFDAVRSAATGIFEAAPRRLPDAVRVENLVDANCSGFDFFGDSSALCEIARPDARRQTEFRVVC